MKIPSAFSRSRSLEESYRYHHFQFQRRLHVKSSFLRVEHRCQKNIFKTMKLLKCPPKRVMPSNSRISDKPALALWYSVSSIQLVNYSQVRLRKTNESKL
jgi:hypothetical protein